MSNLHDYEWQDKYSPEDGNLLEKFYKPALSCAKRYDRSTGFFSADVLAVASTSVEELIRREGHMRLIVGCTLEQPEVDAICKGEEMRSVVDKHLSQAHWDNLPAVMADALELLAWMIAQGFLEVKVAIPCDSKRRPVHTTSLFHEKAGIIEDESGYRLAFNGSLNETVNGWAHNWESFHVFTSWDGTKHLDGEEASFQKLWNDRSKAARVIDLGQAVTEKLLAFLPANDGTPVRLQVVCEHLKSEETTPEPPEIEFRDVYKETWDFIRQAPSQPNGGELVGEATAAVTPWPHQLYAFDRMYKHWPPRLLIADEVGLGKTVQAGLVLRQAWLSGRAKRILVLAPKAVLNQWQAELREKFNLNWPIYDEKKLIRYESQILKGHNEQHVEGDAWWKEPFVLASSYLVRRKDRARQLLEAEHWDIIVLDEAHHARRKGSATDKSSARPNQLLSIMQKLKEHTKGLILLTATPMQVDPVEVWDLLNILGLPEEWSEENFLKFYQSASMDSPDAETLWGMARLFRASEKTYGAIPEAVALHFTKGKKIRAKKILEALRRNALTPFKMLSFEEKSMAVALMKAWTPTKQLISRHTRELLRRYHQAGKIKANIAVREVHNKLVDLSGIERALYEEVEDYISDTYNKAAQDKRQAVGFIMTTYRKRIASSFYALRMTLQHRLDNLQGKNEPYLEFLQEDLPDDEIQDDVIDPSDVEAMESQAKLLKNEEDEIALLLGKTGRLPDDSKASALQTVLDEIKKNGYGKVIIFTQYTDTLDFLRSRLVDSLGGEAVLCYSGRGGQCFVSGEWESLSREETKRLFREGEAQIMICTDAAAEGLNFQFCGAVINYDMPWNPMKVEQRIGRIDRLGQKFPVIQIYNLMYKDTVETDVFLALRSRINLFTSFVGKLQPIISNLPKLMQNLVLKPREEQKADTAQAVTGLSREINETEAQGFDIDEVSDTELEIPARPKPLYDLAYLHAVLTDPKRRPHDVEVTPLDKDFGYRMPGLPKPVRVTTDPEYYEEHSESVELWSPGSPVFPWKEQ